LPDLLAGTFTNQEKLKKISDAMLAASRGEQA
jgi:hypothetical protein